MFSVVNVCVWFGKKCSLLKGVFLLKLALTFEEGYSTTEPHFCAFYCCVHFCGKERNVLVFRWYHLKLKRCNYFDTVLGQCTDLSS